MQSAFFHRVKAIFQTLYLIMITVLLLLNWFCLDFHDFGVNTVIYTVLVIAFGFKFDFLNAKYFPLLTKRFKYNWLNIVNYPLQTLIFFNLFPYPTEKYANVFKNAGKFLHFTTAAGQFNVWGYVGSFILSLLILFPLIFTITIPKAKSMMQFIVVTIEIIVAYVMYLMLSVNSIMSLFGDLTDPGEIISLLAILLVVTPFVYINLVNQNLPLPQLFGKGKSLTIMTALVLVVLFIGAFCIDSAVWLHPFNAWKAPSIENIVFALRSGIGEELIFRGLILGIGVNALKNYKNGMIKGIIVSSLFFGLMHLVNMVAGDDVMAVISSTIDAIGVGFIFAVLYVLTHKLTLVIAIHCVWDLLQEIITGEGNMSVGGLGGLTIAATVAIIFIAGSIWIMKKYKSQFFKDTSAQS
ncbi:CPBP family intramembrane glutamic endopeptidase [Liquorilactobacillus uvarum]|uniref:CPBP family intramembrane glutamic endopeptidase n=2 Tax=Liquorilactobacillus uvarum TaxID=303240 RepID=UPI00288B686A|nr:CPBP family intramembrane glutamic endopeptidase [Liquorilactobacillus uvarum]